MEISNRNDLRPTKPVKARAKAKQPEPDQLWFLEGTVVHTNGRITIERAEHNSRLGRRIMDGWAFRRLTNSEVDYVMVEPVHTLTRERSAGYLRKSERPTEVIGLPGRS